jgi:hypothetical protein
LRFCLETIEGDHHGFRSQLAFVAARGANSDHHSTGYFLAPLIRHKATNGFLALTAPEGALALPFSY